MLDPDELLAVAAKLFVAKAKQEDTTRALEKAIADVRAAQKEWYQRCHELAIGSIPPLDGGIGVDNDDDDDDNENFMVPPGPPDDAEELEEGPGTLRARILLMLRSTKAAMTAVDLSRALRAETRRVTYALQALKGQGAVECPDRQRWQLASAPIPQVDSQAKPRT